MNIYLSGRGELLGMDKHVVDVCPLKLGKGFPVGAESRRHGFSAGDQEILATMH